MLQIFDWPLVFWSLLLPPLVARDVVTPHSIGEHTNILFISVQFRSFLLSGKTGKHLSEFLQKYTDSGTETTHLAGYNILVFK